MVEDNENMLLANRVLFERDGFIVRAARTLAEARVALSEGSVDLALLDIVLPDGNGFDLLPQLRATGDTMVLMLTSKREYQDIVDGLLGGADDYMTKPFRTSELKARVAALLAKRERRRQTAATTTLMRGPLTLDTTALQAFLFGKDMLLTPKEFALLLMLAQNDGVAFSAESLYEKVWGQPMGGDANAVRVAVSRLRSKLDSCDYTITSTRGEGYSFKQAGR